MSNNKSTASLKFKEHKDGLSIENRFGYSFIVLDAIQQQNLFDHFLSGKEKEDKKNFPLKHKMVTQFSEMRSGKVRMVIKTQFEDFSGVLNRIDRKIKK